MKRSSAKNIPAASNGWVAPIVWIRWVAPIVLALAGSVARAQMTDELAGIFRQIIDHVDDDIKQKFERALREQSDLIQFSPDQFRRFRDHPINPFDSLLEIDPRELQGDIELKFELPSLRNRPVLNEERQHESILQDLTELTLQAATSTVTIVRGNRPVALGIVVDRLGRVVTKASELAETGRNPQIGDLVTVVTGTDRRLEAMIVRVDSEYDLALLDARLTDLPPMQWSDHTPAVGEFVLTNDSAGRVVAIGTYSHEPRAVVSTEHAYLGIQPQLTGGEIRVLEVTPGSAAQRVGIRPGDIVRRINDKLITDVTDLVSEVRRQRPGARVEVEIIRDGQSRKMPVELSARQVPDDRAARFLMMNRLGAIPSQRAQDFRLVFQHDTPLFPEQCGGPVLDLNGRVVGMNIARQGRVSTLAIPAANMPAILSDLLREDVASQQ